MTQPIEQREHEVELVAIEGEQLSAITFVQDYLQLHFDGPTITAITWPIVVTNDARYALGEPSYRDQLCGLIAKVVKRAYVRPGDRLEIDFEGHSLVVSLKADAYRAQEAAIFSDGKSEQWAVW